MRLGEVDLRQSIVTRTAANIARLRQGLPVHGLRVRGVVGRDLRRHHKQRLPMERSRVETIADSLHTSQVIVYIELRGDLEPLQRNDRVESNEQIEDGKRREEEPGEKYSDPRRPGEITTSWGVQAPRLCEHIIAAKRLLHLVGCRLAGSPEYARHRRPPTRSGRLC